jgi:alpha-L-rhamnosidase
MEWQAKWINPENYEVDPTKRYPASYLKNKLKVEKGKKYILQATARGTYACFVNGTRVEDQVLTPGPLEEPKLYYFQEHDISSLVKEGDNEIVIVLTDGWHRGSMTNSGKTNAFGTDLALLAQVVDESGNVLVKTDESWQASQDGPIVFSDMMMGETYDARKEEIKNWHEVKILDFKPDELIKQIANPVIEHEKLEGKIITTPKGEKVIDFGQNFAGYIEIDVEAKAGQTVILEMTESLDKDGNFQNANFQDVRKMTYQKEDYTCKEGHNIYKPYGGYWGFRYAKISGTAEVSEKNLKAIAVYNDVKFIGKFSCGLEQVNQFFSNAVWSFKSNLIYVPTDCPTREKGGWTGDFQAYSYTALYLADVYKDTENWLRLLGAEQYDNGCLMGCAPAPMKPSMFDGSSGWCDAIAIVPEKLLDRYDDPKAMEECYPYMKKWADFDLKRAEKTHIWNWHNPYRKYLLDHGFHWGEWLEPGSDVRKDLSNNILKGAPEVCTAYLYNTCRIVAEAAELLGKKDEEKFYADAAENCKKAYNWQFVKNGKLVESTHMCNYVRPLQFGLLDPEVAKDAAQHLNDMLVKANYVQNTGFLTTHALLKVLVDYGYVDTAYKTFLHQGIPGWMYPITKGATSIWENWDGINANGDFNGSLNHYTYGAAVSFLFDSVCGIRLERGKLTICPHPYEEMKHAEAEYDSPVGKIVSNWKYENGKPKIHIEVPVKAAIILPDGTSVLVEKGEYEF